MWGCASSLLKQRGAFQTITENFDICMWGFTESTEDARLLIDYVSRYSDATTDMVIGYHDWLEDQKEGLPESRCETPEDLALYTLDNWDLLWDGSKEEIVKLVGSGFSYSFSDDLKEFSIKYGNQGCRGKSTGEMPNCVKFFGYAQTF